VETPLLPFRLHYSQHNIVQIDECLSNCAILCRLWSKPKGSRVCLQLSGRRCRTVSSALVPFGLHHVVLNVVMIERR
jgi:hypothetical protein